MHMEHYWQKLKTKMNNVFIYPDFIQIQVNLR